MSLGDMLAHASNPNTQEAEAGGLGFQDQPGTHKSLSQKLLILKIETKQ